ncbi:MAG: phosphoadenosine phosphosulfate reductase family protein, partial [Thermoplasmata archaeon]
QLLGEKGLLGHVAGLSEQLIRVPLAVRPPAGIAGRRVSSPVDITDLFTLLSFIATEGPGALESWLEQAAQSDTVVSEAHGNHVPYVLKLERYDPTSRKDLIAFRSNHDNPALACIEGNWKLICHLGKREDELYELKTDPEEKVNLVTRNEDRLNELHEKLRQSYLKETSAPLGRELVDHLSLDAKRVIAETVLKNALQDNRKPVVLWTGGKDSTLVLHLASEVAERSKTEPPPLLFIDHGQHFPETWSFMEDLATKANLKTIVAQNEDFLTAAEDGADTVPLEVLNPENQAEALKAGLRDARVLRSLETAVGNHLLKTVALKHAIRKGGFDTVITGIRWDESPARSGEVFFSPREDPLHMRVHPILPWTEREVWAYTLENGLPIHPLYRQGYRSFDGVRDSEPTGTRPAWEQDLQESSERAGRAQDKEKIMERLRALGYF